MIKKLLVINKKSAMPILKSKKGFFFTFLAIMLVSILLIIFIKTPAAQSQKQSETVKIKVNLMNDFMLTLKNSYIPRILYFSAKEVLINFSRTEDPSIFQDSTGPANKPIDVFGTVFADNMSGQLNPLLLQISTISLSKLNIYSEINMSSFTLVQQDPWTLQVSGLYSIYIRSNESDIIFNVTQQNVSVLIPIDGFEDPLFARKAKLFSTNETTRIIKKSSNLHWDKDITAAFYQNKQYRESTNAPSFLDRVKGNYQSSSFGIETLIDPITYTPNANGYADIDYKFFTPISDCKYNSTDKSVVSNLYEIKYIQSGFYLDVEHIGKYNLTDQIGAPYSCPPPGP